MASFVKFDQFVTDLCQGFHDLSTHQLKVYLTDATPSTTADAVKADLAESAGGNGYTTGGHAVTVDALTNTAGVATVDVTTDIVITATGGSIPASGTTTFRYVVLYNDDQTSPADPLIGYWDYGSPITLAIGESLTIDFTDDILSVQ